MFGIKYLNSITKGSRRVAAASCSHNFKSFTIPEPKAEKSPLNIPMAASAAVFAINATPSK